MALNAQGNPNGWSTGGNGNGNGGPPPPPTTYCDSNPGDPACDNGVAVPIGDWKWQIGSILIGLTYAGWKIYEQTKLKENERTV